MSLLHPTSPLPALPLLRPPKSLLSDGGNRWGHVGAAAARTGWLWGLFRGVRSMPAAGRAPATFPDPHHTRLFPADEPPVTTGWEVPHLHPMAPYPGVYLAGSRNGARSSAPHTHNPLKPKSPRNKIPKAPSCSGGPPAAPARPAHGWQWGSGLPGAWGWTCLKYFPCCISTRGTLPPPFAGREGAQAPLPSPSPGEAR